MTSSTQKIHVDIPGLDLILGGGLPILARGAHGTYYPPSATVLIRGGPGSGKTVLGTQIAGSLGRALGCDVAYACVEMLPTELAAQHGALGRPRERILWPPWQNAAGNASLDDRECRIFAAMLKLDSGSEQQQLDGEIEGLLQVVKQCGGSPRVVVVDALSDGYGLGASASRIVADALCKYAAYHGLIMVLLEETIDDRASPWRAVCDVLLELNGAPEHRIAVAKNRLAPCDVGPHRFMIEPLRGVLILPRPSCYLAPWAAELVLPLPDPPSPAPPIQDWGIPIPDLEAWPAFRHCFTVVHGSNTADVLHLVKKLGVTSGYSGPRDGFDIIVNFGPSTLGPVSKHKALVVQDPHRGDAMLAGVIGLLQDLQRQDARVARVLVGDLRRLRSVPDREEILRSLVILAAILRRAGLPCIFFETSADAHSGETALFIADVSIRVASGADGGPVAIVTQPLGGLAFRFPLVIEPEINEHSDDRANDPAASKG